jgi:Txe/YoeB family toxin of toxin-antitoxin system
VVKWTIKYSRRVLSDSLKLKRAGLKEKTQKLLGILAEDPYAFPPYFEKLSGFEDVYSRRINIRHRLVYQVFKDEMVIKILSLWGHYDDN